MEPMLLSPVGKDYLWGGIRLKTEYGKQLDVFPLAETWECSVHRDGQSKVRNGRHVGCLLGDVLKRHTEYLGKRAEGRMPLLVKLIDARTSLSVQVHPDDNFARTVEGDNGKSEMWYVLEADPKAQIVYGFAHPVTAGQLRDSIADGSLSKHLQYIPVKRGDTFFIAPGTVHAIGAGVVIAEIQESSNVTYRVYDYDRIDKDGNKRELHFDKAVQVLNMAAEPEVRQRQKLIKYYPGCSRELLCRCRYFEVERIQVARIFSFSVTDKSFQLLLCIEGVGDLNCVEHSKSVRFQKGDCIFIPAETGRCNVIGNTALLKVRC